MPYEDFSRDDLIRKEALGLAVSLAEVLIKTGVAMTTDEVVADAKSYFAFLNGTADTSDPAQLSAKTQSHSS